VKLRILGQVSVKIIEQISNIDERFQDRPVEINLQSAVRAVHRASLANV
jgi:hypothetical protein